MTSESGDMEPLGEELREFLDAERELDPVPAATRARLLTHLAPLLIVPAAGAPGAVEPDAAGEVASGVAQAGVKAGLGAKLIVPVLCTALGAAGGAGAHAYFAGTPPPAPAPRIVQPAAPAPSTFAVPPAVPPSAALEVEAPPAASASARATPQQVAPGSLRAERLLLESATAALMRGDSASAMASLQKHARQYPRGALAEEREVLLVKALRAQGDEKAAEQRASDFKRRFPSSLQQRAVDKPPVSK